MLTTFDKIDKVDKIDKLTHVYTFTKFDKVFIRPRRAPATLMQCCFCCCQNSRTSSQGVQRRGGLHPRVAEGNRRVEALQVAGKLDSQRREVLENRAAPLRRTLHQVNEALALLGFRQRVVQEGCVLLFAALLEVQFLKLFSPRVDVRQELDVERAGIIQSRRS